MGAGSENVLIALSPIDEEEAGISHSTWAGYVFIVALVKSDNFHFLAGSQGDSKAQDYAQDAGMLVTRGGTVRYHKGQGEPSKEKEQRRLAYRLADQQRKEENYRKKYCTD